MKYVRRKALRRDASVHIPVSEDRLREINERALLVDLPWDLKINNSEFQDETDIAQAVQELLHHQENSSINSLDLSI